MNAHVEIEHVRRHRRVYFLVFGTLLVLTAVTVAVSSLRIPTAEGITIALLIAAGKGTLVAGIFMHLFSDRKRLINIVLIFSAIFFLALVLLVVISNANTYWIQ